MESYISLFKGILLTESNYLNIYIDGLEEHGGFCAKSLTEEVTQCIGSLLTKSTSRKLGLRLLTKFLDHCSVDVFESKGNLWTTLVLKTCSTQELRNDASLIFEVLGKIIVKSQHAPGISKCFATIHLPKVYEILKKNSSYRLALRCIELCLQLYPNASGPFKHIIEEVLWENIDYTNNDIVNDCGKCLHLLQLVKGSGTQGINPKTQWKNYQIQLLGGIHAVYNEMFANCTEVYDGVVVSCKLPLSNKQLVFDYEPVKKAAQMYTRCHYLIKYLVIALREPFPVEKPILLKKILNVIKRGLSVNCIILERNQIPDNIALSVLLPKLHVDLLELLNAVIVILRGYLRPHEEFILDLIMDTLKWTSTKSSDGNKKLRILRKKAYESFSLWCKVFHSGISYQLIAEYFFQGILSDITPFQNGFALKVLRGARKQMSKQARRQFHSVQNENSNSQTLSVVSSIKNGYYSEKRDQILCISALRCLQDVLLSVANFIKPTLLKLIQINITQICLKMYELPMKNTCLYSNNYCRIEIYNLLYVLLMTPHNLCPPPTETALSIIQNAFVSDCSINVRIRCSYILHNIEKIIHPQKESLLYPSEARDIRNTFIKMGQENLLRESEIFFSNSSLIDPVDMDNGVEFIETQTTGRQISEDIEQAEKYNNHVKNNSTQAIYTTKNELKTNPRTEDVGSTDSVLANSSKSPEILSRLGGNEEIGTKKGEMMNCDNNICELIIKKPKLQNENCQTSEIQTIEASVCSYENDQDDEDHILTEIASQFVDELD